MKMRKAHICRYCYEGIKSRGERIKVIDEYAIDIDDGIECEMCNEVDDLMEVEM